MGRVGYKMVTDLVNSGYVTAGFEPKQEYCVEQGNFIQEGAIYRREIQHIFGTVEFWS